MGNHSSKTLSPERHLDKTSKVKILLNHLSYSLDFNLEENYLNAPDFPLTPKGPPLVQLKHPVKLSKKSIYIGECNKSIITGLGYMITEDSNFYEGYFENHLFHGQGRLFTSKNWIIQGKWYRDDLSEGKILNFNSKTFEGQLKNLEPNGFGGEKSDSFEYQGQFLNSKKHGKGKVTWTDGSWYEGEFVNGKIEGFGKYHWVDSEYEGQWKAGKMHGLGVYIWTDGRRYEGNFLFGQRDGYGVYTEANRRYSGYWRAGKEDGQGRLEEDGRLVQGIWTYGKLNKSLLSDISPKSVITGRSANIGRNVSMEHVKFPERIREKCKGVIEIWEREGKFEWGATLVLTEDKWIQVGKGVYYGETNIDGLPHGKGLWLSPSLLYEGDFFLSKKEGFGRSISIQKELYKGDWRKDRKCGFGVLHKEDSLYVGEWSHDRFTGRGKIETPSFTYDGNWKKGLQHGLGTMEYPDKTVYIGWFVYGVVSGEGKLKYPNGKCIEGLWEEGKVQKVTKKYYAEGVDNDENDVFELLRIKELKEILCC